MHRTPRRLSDRDREWYRDATNVQFDDPDETDAPGIDLGDIQEEEMPAIAPEMQDHYFSNLNRFGVKILKFQQRKSMSNIPDSNGVCLSVALMWIKEKTQTSNSCIRKNRSDSKIFVPHAVDADTHTYNADIMQQAEIYQNLLENGADISPINDALGLIPTAHSVSLSWQNANNIREINFPDTLARAANDLPKGKAICFEIRVQRPYLEDDGHAVSIYRSRGGSLHRAYPVDADTHQG
jgi:hypothetical protein